MSLVAAVTLLCGGFAGCGGGGATSSNGKTQFSVGGWPSKEGKDKENMEAKKARFEEANPEFEVVPDNWAFDLRSFYPKAAGGQLPTVFGTHFTEVSQIIAAGYSADLTDTLKKEGLYDKINSDVLEIVSNDGKVYAFPYSAYAIGLAFNVDMMEAAGLMETDGTPKQPKDWYELAEFAVKIKEATGKPGFVFPSSNNYGGWIFTPVAWSFGADFMEKGSDGKWKAIFDSPEATEALQFIKDLKWKYDVLPANTLIDGEEYYKILGTGGAGIQITAGDVPRKLTAYGMQPEQIGMMAIPRGPKRYITLMGGSVYAVSDKANEKQIEGAIKWLETSYTPNATEEYKKNTETDINKRLENNELIAIKSMSVWDSDSDAVKFKNEIIDSKANANINHVKLYNDFVADLGDCELRPEEPVCAQELYGILDGCIQEVLTNKDTDCAALLKKACSDFQVNHLDNLDY